MASAGYNHSLGVLTNGLMWTWGSHANGRTGLNMVAGHTSFPDFSGRGNLASVSAGDSHSLGVTTNGELWAWGNNANGRTGLGTTTGNTLVPTRVGN